MTSMAGHFLIARPVLRDPNFARTVVLLLQHGSVGAFGVVVNRPAKAKGVPFPVFAGGPCESPGLLMLHGHKDWLDDSAEEVKREVAPGIFLGDASCLKKINDPGPEDRFRFRMFAGNSGWGPGQLEGELAGGAWVVVPASGALLFDTPIDELWTSLLPPQFPEPSAN